MKKLIFLFLFGLIARGSSAQTVPMVQMPVDMTGASNIASMIDAAKDPLYTEEMLVQLLLAFPFEYRQYLIPGLHKMRSISEKTRTMPGIIEWRGKLPTRIAPELQEYAKVHLKYLPPAYYPILMPEAWPSFYRQKEGDMQKAFVPRTYDIHSEEEMTELFGSSSYESMLQKRGVSTFMPPVDTKGGLTAKDIEASLAIFNQIKSLGEGVEGQKRKNDLLMMLTPDKLAQATAFPCASLVERLPQIGAGEWLTLQTQKQGMTPAEFANKCDRMIKAYRIHHLAPSTADQIRRMKLQSYFWPPQDAYKKEIWDTLAEMVHSTPADVEGVKPFLGQIEETLTPHSLIMSTPVLLDF